MATTVERPAPPRPPIAPRRAHQPPRRRSIWPIVVAVLLVLVLAPLVLAGVALAAVTRNLPSLDNIETRTTFQSAQIFDRNGQLLWEISDPSGGKRTVVPLDQISPYLIKATLAAEDAHFYDEPGFDPVATARSAVLDLTGQGRSGASTITQQLVRNVLLDPAEAQQQTVQRKLREIVLAQQLTQRYSKDQILEMYLNTVYYGNQSYGVEAASQGYFAKSAKDLSLAEAALIAGLVQSPSALDPTRTDVPRTADGIPVATKDRQRYVLERVADNGSITRQEAADAYSQKLTFQSRHVDMKAPHWVMYVKNMVEQQLGDRMLYQAGLRIYTTLDLSYDQKMQKVLQQAKQNILDHGGNNAALIAVNPHTGEILAFDGSLDFNDASIQGQVNVLTSERQPGSSIKPVVYSQAFTKGWSPGTSIEDVPTCWEDQPGHQWCPHNFDDKFHGQVTARTALGNSLNIPAVKTLEYAGVPQVVDLGQKMGITTWGPDSGKTLGLSLTLGGAEVRPIDLAQVYATLANGGRKMPLVAVRRITDATGNVIQDYQVPSGDQVLDPRVAYMISNVLSDPAAKLFTYGRDTPLILKDRPAASKTGTTDNYRDTWTAGYTPNLAIVVWVGNTNGTPMKEVLSSMTAGQIWPAAMEASFQALNLPEEDFQRPDGLVERQVCGDTAMRPGEPACRNDLFFADRAPATAVPSPTVATTAAPVAPAIQPTAPPAPAPAENPTAAPEATQAPQPTALPHTSAPAAAPTRPTPVSAPTKAPAQPTAAPAAPTVAPAPTKAPAQPTVASQPAPTKAPAAPQPTPKPAQ